jgi:hypothetical protein
MENPMDARTLEALKGSIAKWEAIVAGTGKDDGYFNCPLCKLFNDQGDDEDDCVKCPVFIRVRARYCENSPYYAYRDAIGTETDGFGHYADARTDLHPASGGEPARCHAMPLGLSA